MASFLSCLLIGGSLGEELEEFLLFAPFAPAAIIVLFLPAPPNDVLVLLLLLMLVRLVNLLPGDARGLPRGLPKLLFRDLLDMRRHQNSAHCQHKIP